jgi:pyridoxine kinase
MMAPHNRNRKKGAVIAISSHVARGAIGNRGAVFALERFRYRVWAVPTVVLPFHPGHGRATRFVPDAGAFSAMLDELLDSPWIDEVVAVSSGYLANAGQVESVARFVTALGSRIRYLCDPVVGDAGGLYVEEAVAIAIRDRLLPLADLATPNLHELAWMAGASIPGDPAGAALLARRLGPAMVIATSVPAGPDRMANVLVGGKMAVYAGHRRCDGPSNGSGDMFAALFLAQVLDGISPEISLRVATERIVAMHALAGANGEIELCYQSDWDRPPPPGFDIVMGRLDDGTIS